MLPHRERVLLVNYDFPPGLSGVRRMVKLAKYLPDFDIDPVILCASPDERMPMDMEALREITAQGYPVTRTPSLDPYHVWNSARKLPRVFGRVRSLFDATVPESDTGSATQVSIVSRPNPLSAAAGRVAAYGNQLFAVPDDRVGWLPFALPAAEALLRRQAIRYVVTSSFPHSAHLIGQYLKRRYRIKWIADFRDGWTQNPYFAKYGTPVHRRWSKSLERSIARNADAITTVSEPIAQHLRSLAGNKVHVIPNGFDPDDFSQIQPIEFDKFTLAYTGTLFMQRSPENFFAAVRGLLDCYPGLNDNFQVIFRTKFKPDHEEAIDAMGLRHVIHNWGMGSYQEALQLQMSADALLVLEGEAPNSEIMLTQKIFEYLATGKPILAVAPPGALATLVRQTRAGVVVPPENIFRIKETLFEMFLARLAFRRDEELIATFHRRKQAQQFASIFRQISRAAT